MASSPRYRRNGNIKWAVGNTSEKQTLKSASVIQFNKSAAVLATVKGKSLRDGLRPPLTAAARSGQRKLGWDEEMVAVRSNKEMVKNSSLDTNRPIQVQRDVMEDLPGLRDQSALTPANFTTLADFSVSSAMNFPKSAGEPGRAVAPNSASRAFILGSARAALISLLSLSTISTGVFFGAPTPVQKLDS